MATVQDPKSRPNRRRYLEALARMSPEDKLRKAFELTSFCRALLAAGLASTFPGLSEEERRRLYLVRLDRCHNKTF
ncbi:MAG: hypothetical protein AAB152_05135 [Candidatus Coatesbacteria bacterium]